VEGRCRYDNDLTRGQRGEEEGDEDLRGGDEVIQQAQGVFLREERKGIFTSWYLSYIGGVLFPIRKKCKRWAYTFRIAEAQHQFSLCWPSQD
jgi:hypothetical protein